MLRVLITNDDGVLAPGISALASRLAAHADVVVVAPEKPSSARSHCITLHKPLRLQPVAPYLEPAGKGSLAVFSCSGTPVDCVVLGLDHVCRDRKPDLLISGINDGYNVAEDLIYSGTVGGAVEGAINGIPSLAVSQGRFDGMDLEASAAILDLLVGLLLYGCSFPWHKAEIEHLQANAGRSHEGQLDLAGLPQSSEAGYYPKPGTWYPAGLSSTPCLNLNIPAIPVAEICGLCWTASGKRDYVDVVQSREDPFGRQYFWIAGERVLMEEQAGTDTWALAQGLVSATPMHYNLTCTADLPAFRALRVNRGG